MFSSLASVATGLNRNELKRLSGGENFVHKRGAETNIKYVNQCQDLKMGMARKNLGALTTEREREFWVCLIRFHWEFGRL